MSESFMADRVESAVAAGLPPAVASATLAEVLRFVRMLAEAKAAQASGVSVAPLWRGDPLDVIAAEVERRRLLADPGLPLWCAACERVRVDVEFLTMCRELAI